MAKALRDQKQTFHATTCKNQAAKNVPEDTHTKMKNLGRLTLSYRQFVILRILIESCVKKRCNKLVISMSLIRVLGLRSQRSKKNQSAYRSAVVSGVFVFGNWQKKRSFIRNALNRAHPRKRRLVKRCARNWTRGSFSTATCLTTIG